MRIASITLGCKVNQYETQAMESELRKRGHTICSKEDQPDTYIINTCAVTAESGRKSRQLIRRIIAANPDAVVAVCGCYAQLSAKDIAALGAHLVSGSGERLRFVDELEKVYEQHCRSIFCDDAMQRRIFEPLKAGSVFGRTRSMLKIEDGCQNFCSYCIIPYVRGPIRSLPVEEAVEEAKRLYNEGYAELVITGIEIASYGKDLGGREDLASLVCKIADATPGMRLRLGSLDPAAVSEQFCSSLPKIGLCEHFHLSMQSGCSATLKRMNRRNDAEGLLSAVSMLRKYFPTCALTADLITGFPGETEEEFSETLETARKCSFASMHVFPYSVRPGTAAERMPGQVAEAVKAERAKRARAIANTMKNEYLSSCVGRTLKVLLETEKDGFCFGHAENYCDVRARGEFSRGEVVSVHITAVNEDTLVGNIIN